MDIVFIILHYCTQNDTIACIDSIRQKTENASYHIVVVDNASANGSLEILQKEYSDAADVTLIANSENLGFARGLNIGINYARKNFDPDFIALVNNDIMLVSSDFTSKVRSKYEQYHFAVLGPMIVTADGLCNVNPVFEQPRNADEMKSLIASYGRIEKVCNAHLFGLYSVLKKFKPKKKKPVKTLHLNDLTDCMLHGCFWILSRKFFTKFDGLNPETFLYVEEDILYLSVLRAGLHTLYTPDICIYHKENSSTDAVLPRSSDKARFISKYNIESMNIYLKILAEETVTKDNK